MKLQTLLALATMAAVAAGTAHAEFTLIAGVTENAPYHATRDCEEVDSGVVSAAGLIALPGAQPGHYVASTIVIPDCADLLVAALETNPTSPACGDTLRGRFLVQNTGPGPVTTTFRGVLTVDNLPRCTSSFQPLAAGGQVWTAWCLLGVLTSGQHSVEACVDPDRVVPESNESNNCR